MNDQTAAVYAAEEMWIHRDPSAGIRFGDWMEVQPFYVTLASHFREQGEEIYPPTVVPSKTVLKAHYDPHTKSVHIPPYERGGVWALNAGTAIHEFAHHLVPAGGHGPDFRAAMIQCLQVLGWDHTFLETAYAEAGLGLSAEDDGILAHVAKIYAQADAPGRTTEEKQAFLERAQMLATRHQIDLAILRKKEADRSGRSERTRPTASKLFPLTALTNATHRKLVVDLASNIANAHGATLTIHGKSQYLTFYGFPEDVDLTQLMVTRVTPMMFEAADEYVASPERKATGVSAVSARIAFCQSFSSEVGRRLRAAVKQTTEKMVEEERQITENGETTGTEIALRAKELEVRDFVAYEFKRLGVRGTWKGSRSSDWSMTSYEAGRKAANEANLFGHKLLGGS